MIAEIIAVGTEILLGDIVNTDAQFLSRQLSELGIALYHSEVVGDNEQRLTEAIELALSRADMVILSGGLGPTDDDISKETAAKVMGFDLELDRESLERMENHFKGRNAVMPKTNIKQAYMPKGGIILKNDCGTAPGCVMEKDSKRVVLLPGPPRELEMMFLKYLKPILLKESDSQIKSRVLRIYGMGESAVSEKVRDYIRFNENPTVAPYAKNGECTLRITAKAPTQAECDEMISKTETELREILGDVVYGVDDNTLEKTVVDLLRENNLTVSTAESCTGGLISAAITSVPGSSDVFGFGFATYANEAKMKLLGVKKETLDKYGAVSAQTAEEMAKGAKEVSGADMAVSVTGIAGPGGGSEEKPVGLVYIGFAYKDKVESFKINNTGSRDRIRHLTVMKALDTIRRAML